MKQYHLIINGMGGEHCVHVIKTILAKQTGIITSNVENGKADISIDEESTSIENIISAIEKMGYKVNK